MKETSEIDAELTLDDAKRPYADANHLQTSATANAKKDVIQERDLLESISKIKSSTSQLGSSARIICNLTSEMSTFSGSFSCLQRCAPAKLPIVRLT